MTDNIKLPLTSADITEALLSQLRDAFRNVQVPSVATLRPQPAESVNWDSSKNLIIEGDNLEVLKLLQKIQPSLTSLPLSHRSCQ